MTGTPNPVPLGQAGTGEAVVLGPSTAPNSLARIGQQFAMGVAAGQRLQGMQARIKQQNEENMLRDQAKSLDFDNNNVFLPHQKDYMNRIGQATDKIAQLYNSGLARTPQGQAEVSRIKIELASYANRSREFGKQYYNLLSAIDRESAGTAPLLKRDVAKQRLNALFKNPDGTDKPADQIDITVFDNFFDDPSIYNKDPFWNDAANQLKSNVFKFKDAGGYGKENTAREMLIQGPYVKDEAGNPLLLNKRGERTTWTDPEALPVHDWNAVYNSIGDQRFRNIIDAEALPIYNQLTGSNFKEIPQDMTKVDLQAWGKAVGQVYENNMNPRIKDQFSYIQSLNPQPRKVGGSGAVEKELKFTFSDNSPFKIGDVEYQTPAIFLPRDKNANTFINVGDRLVDTKRNNKYVSEKQIPATSAGFRMMLEAVDDINAPGLRLKKGMTTAPKFGSNETLKDLYNKYPGKLRYVWAEQLNVNLPKEDYVEFLVGPNGATDPIYGTKYKPNITIQVPKNSERYQALKNAGETSFEQLSTKVGPPSEPESVTRVAAYVNPDTGEITQEDATGFVSDKVRNTIAQESQKYIGAESGWAKIKQQQTQPATNRRKRGSF